MRSIRALTAVLLAAVLVGPLATPARADACTDDRATLDQRLKCWAATARNSFPVLVTLKSALRELGQGDVDLARVRDELRRGPLVVSVPDRQVTGPGGTLLMILAGPGRRLVARSAQISTLDRRDYDRLVQAGLCEQPDPGKEDPLCARASRGQATGTELLAAGPSMARELAAADITVNRSPASRPKAPASGASKDGDGGGGLTEPLLIGTAAALLLALLGFFLLRLRPASAPAGARSPVQPTPRRRNDARPVSHRTPHGSPPPGRRRSATVRTDLHPQGYVELDRCLYRAAWADDQEPPPPPGGHVDVVEGTGADSDLLLAYPTGR